MSCLFQQGEFISIHALREEGDGAHLDVAVDTHEFLSTPSARRATLEGFNLDDNVKFLSTPSARRATFKTVATRLMPEISIHALREEGDP